MDGLTTGTTGGVPWRADERCREVDAALRRLAATKAEYDADEAHWLRAGREAGVYLHQGFATYIEYLERVFGYSPRLAAERLRVAESLAHLPDLERALERGWLHWSAVRELVRVALVETEEEWIAAARGLTVREVEALVAGHRPGDRPGDPRDPTVLEKVLRLEVSADTYALFREARRRVQEEAGCSMTDEQVLAALCRAVLGGPDKPGRGGHPIALTVCPRCEQTTVGGPGELLPVPPAPPARCDGHQIGATHVGQSRRAHPNIPSVARRPVLRRAHRRCAAPGCRSSRYLEAHYIAGRADGGMNEASNVIVLCGLHRRLLREGRLRIEGTAPDDVRFLRADGRPYRASATNADKGRDVMAALRQLGFDEHDSRDAIAYARTHVGVDAPIEALLFASLRALGRGALDGRNTT